MNKTINAINYYSKMFDKSDDYGFFCDLESSNIMEYDEVEYYVVTKRTHYEVRRKLSSRPIIKGDPNLKVSDLSCTKSSLDDINCLDIYPKNENKWRLLSFLRKLPRDIYYSLVICITTSSCIYFVLNQPDYNNTSQ